MGTTDQTLLEQLRLGSREISQRKEFFAFTQEDGTALYSLRQFMSEHMQEIVDSFYKQILPFRGYEKLNSW